MRISNWSSDVCSSDLSSLGRGGAGHREDAVDVVLVQAGVGEGRAECIDAEIERGAPVQLALRRGAHARNRDSLGKCQSLSSCLRRVAKGRSEEHTSELQSLMRISYAVFCLKKNN